MKIDGVKEIAVARDNELVLGVLRLRYWQHVMNELLKRKEFTIPIHLGFGHEAVAEAVHTMMIDGDQLVLTHRNITYNLARAGALKPLYDEYKLKSNAVCGGKLASMNLTNPARGVAYSSSILGNNLSVACGLALGMQTLGRPGIVTVLTGDGGMEEGQFYESIVFARAHSLKVLFLVENNNMAMSSTIEQRRRPILLEQVCSGVDIPFQCLEGNDVFEYAATLQSLRQQIDDASLPACVEAGLPSMNQHAGPTPGWPADPKIIDMANGLIVEHTSSDPVFVLKQKIGAEAFKELEKEVMEESWAE